MPSLVRSLKRPFTGVLKHEVQQSVIVGKVNSICYLMDIKTRSFGFLLHVKKKSQQIDGRFKTIRQTVLRYVAQSVINSQQTLCWPVEMGRTYRQRKTRSPFAV